MVIYDNLNRDSGDDGEGRPQRGCELVGSLINCSLRGRSVYSGMEAGTNPADELLYKIHNHSSQE